MREQGTGRTQILGYHIIQSFKPDEITPEQALAVSEELCDRYLKGNYQYVLAVHSDRDHLHTHIVFNNTNVYNGLSFTYEENQGGRRERAWAKLRAISDEICQEHGLSVIAEPEKGQSVSHFERDMQLQGKSWKDKLRAKIAEVAFYLYKAAVHIFGKSYEYTAKYRAFVKEMKAKEKEEKKRDRLHSSYGTSSVSADSDINHCSVDRSVVSA